MSKFDEFWVEVLHRFPSETSAIFAKPLLKEAFDAGRKIGQADSKKTTTKPVTFA